MLVTERHKKLPRAIKIECMVIYTIDLFFMDLIRFLSNNHV